MEMEGAPQNYDFTGPQTLRNKMASIIIPETFLFVRGESFKIKTSL